MKVRRPESSQSLSSQSFETRSGMIWAAWPQIGASSEQTSNCAVPFSCFSGTNGAPPHFPILFERSSSCFGGQNRCIPTFPHIVSADLLGVLEALDGQSSLAPFGARLCSRDAGWVKISGKARCAARRIDVIRGTSWHFLVAGMGWCASAFRFMVLQFATAQVGRLLGHKCTVENPRFPHAEGLFLAGNALNLMWTLP